VFRFARTAVELATQTEYFETIADSYLALGEILDREGDSRRVQKQ
jgi:hypothetical protein